MNQYTLIQRLNLLRSLKLIRKARRNIVEKVPARSDDIGQISQVTCITETSLDVSCYGITFNLEEKNESPALFAFNSWS